MRRGILLFLISMYGCAIQKAPLNQTNEEIEIRLDFQDCNPEQEFEFLELTVPSGYQLSKIEEHGFCEYRLVYADESILYVSTNTYSGSKLNYKNRLDKEIRTYSTNRSENDTIRNSGVEANQNYWLEWINGNYVVGYIHAQDTLKFDRALGSAKLIL